MPESGVINKVKNFFGFNRTKKSKRTYHVGLFFGLLAAVFSFLLMAAGVFHNYDRDLHALVMQMGFVYPVPYEKMLIVKKDQATSELLGKNPDRAEFASLFSMLGQNQIMKRANEGKLPSLHLLTIDLGYFKEIKELPFKTSFNDWSGFIDPLAASTTAMTSEQSKWQSMSRQVREYFKANPQNPGFISFIKVDEHIWPPTGQNAFKALAGGRDFLLLPTLFADWGNNDLISFIAGIKESAGVVDEGMKEAESRFSTQLKLLQRWEKLFANLARSSINFDLSVCPRENTFLSICLSLDVAPPPSEYIVEPADVIGFDFVLQGEKENAPATDLALENAIASASCKVILAGHTKTEEDLSERIAKTGEINLSSHTTLKSRLIMPHSRFVKGNAEVALIDVSIGNKSYVTEVPLFVLSEQGRRLWPTFSLKIALTALDKKFPDRNPSYISAMEAELSRIYDDVASGTFHGPLQINDLVIPVNSNGRMIIDFVGSTSRAKGQYSTIPSVSLYECLDRETLKAHYANRPEKFALIPENAYRRTMALGGNKGNKIVLVGPFELSDFDYFPTPLDFDTPYRKYSEQLMGIEIHANAIINILERRYIKHPDGKSTALALLFSCLLLGFLLDILSPLTGALLTLGFMATAFWQSYESYHVSRQIFNVAPLLFSFPLIWTLSTLTSYIRQRLQAKATKDMFSRFVAADVVQYMLDNPELVRPGGEKVELTIFFSDVAGFTSISEALTPEELVVLLNEYLGAMTDLLFEYGGTLDKFIGDAVMAFWNFPRKQEDHAVRACLCAIAMQRKINELQIGWAERGLPRVSARAGINTANVVVGYMGSQKAQMNFTCMGDGVNLASRLEGANKEYGTALMVSDATYQRVKHVVTGRFLDFLAVKGKKEPVKVFELVSEKGKEPPEWEELAAMYDEGIQLHLDRKWDEAIATFEKALQRWPNDGPSATYLSRCQEYKLTPPPEGWDGRYILTHK